MSVTGPETQIRRVISPALTMVVFSSLFLSLSVSSDGYSDQVTTVATVETLRLRLLVLLKGVR
jgi:hypothetical protein